MHISCNSGLSEDREEQDCTRRPEKSAHAAVGLVFVIHAGRQSLRDLQFAPLPSPSITAAAAGRGEGQRSRLGQSNAG